MIAPEWLLKDNCDIDECDRDVLVLEINKLRAALKSIIESVPYMDPHGQGAMAINIAREALAAPKGS